MTETFEVDCPGCGTQKRYLSTNASQIGIHCSCGVSASVDVEAQAIDEWSAR